LIPCQNLNFKNRFIDLGSESYQENPFEDRPELFKKYNIEANYYSQDTPQEFLGHQTSCSA
jgi:hypothetical protein